MFVVCSQSGKLTSRKIICLPYVRRYIKRGKNGKQNNGDTAIQPCYNSIYLFIKIPAVKLVPQDFSHRPTPFLRLT